MYLIYHKTPQGEAKRLENVLLRLLAEEQAANVSRDLVIAVGFGSCLDLLVDGIPLMKALDIKPPSKAKYHEDISTLQELSEMFAFFLEQGAAVERFISLKMLRSMVKTAGSLSGSRWAGGGNAPVMSNRFIKEGFKNVIVGAQASEKIKSFYSSNIHFSENSNGEDDIHLILEYEAGETWGKFTASRANRFIVHSDQKNPYIGSLESFENVIRETPPRLVIVSALQMLDNFPFEAGVRETRMSALTDMLKETPRSTLLHFEMASFSEVAMMESILTHVIPFVDSLGMNEQELPNVVSMFQHGEITTHADSNPRTATVLDNIRELYRHLQTRSGRGLTRIHVHTLAFQAILLKTGSQWKNNKAGAAKASLTAYRHVCGLDTVDVNKARLIMDESFSLSVNSEKRVYFNESSPISCWDEEDYEICVAPVLVCTAVKQTVGGGDNITPAGLILQI